MKVGDAVQYDAGDTDDAPPILSLVSAVHDEHTVSIAWMGQSGSWHAAGSVPARAEGGGVTWRPL